VSGEQVDGALADPSTFLSGDAGDVIAPWRRTKRRLGEVVYEALDVATRNRRRAARLADAVAPRRVLVVGVYRAGSLLPEALPDLRSERHQVTFAFGATGSAEPELAPMTAAADLSGGKFENLNRVLRQAAPVEADWTLVVDDDVRLPAGFLDLFLGLCEHFRLDLAQPAQTLRSHSAWKVTRRRPASLVRETRFVEIGPVTAFGRRAAGRLLPFPELRYGWGLDLHWAAVAAEYRWRLGVVDALSVRHRAQLVAADYPREAAVGEAARFLSDRPYLSREAAGDTLVTHRRARG
jgi:hypothetical protein